MFLADAPLGVEYQESDEVLQVIFAAIAPPLETAILAIENFGSNFDPLTAPDSWLDWLLQQIGWPVDESFTPWQKREILKRVPDWRKRYGQKGIIESIVQLYFRLTVSNIGLDIQLEPRISTPGGFRIGKGRVGRSGIWNRYSRNNLLVTITNWNDVADNATNRQRLELFLDKLIPAFMTTRILN